MADKTVAVRLRAEVAQYIAGLQKAKVATKDLTNELSGAGRTSTKDLDRLGRGAAIAAGSIALGFAAAAKASIDWESAWAGVTKTVEGSEAELASLEDGLRSMAQELPATHGEIAAVAEAAGALGVATPHIEDFTRVMIDLGETTDLTADQAANSMARIANVMQTPQDKFDEMGSTLVELGNNGASTESEILELSTRLAAAGQIAGLTEANVMAFASTLSSVGVEAEAGGTALSKVFVKIRDSVLDGGETLEVFAEVAGVTAQEFAASFAADPAAAIDSFIQGLGRINDAGQSTTGVFAALELTDQRLMRALLSTAGAGDLLAESLATADGAWRENTALQTEAAKRYETTAAQAEMLRNKVVDLGIGIGDQLLPAINGSVDFLGQMAAGFGALDGTAGTALHGIAGVSGVALAGVAIFAKLVPKIQEMRTALLGMGAAGQFASRAVPWLAAAAAAIGVVSYVLGEQDQAAEEAEESIRGWSDAIEQAGSESGGFRTQLDLIARENLDLAEAIDQSGMTLDQWVRGLTGTEEQFHEFVRVLAEAGVELTGFIEMTSGGGLGGGTPLGEGLNIKGLRDDMMAGAEAADLHAARTTEAGAAAAGSVPGVDALTGAMEDEATAAEDAAQALDDLLTARQSQISPMFNMLDATQQVGEAQQDLADAYVANTDAVDDNNVSTAEVEALHRAAAMAALEQEAAATRLAAAVDNGSVSLDGASAMLQTWVANGSLTEAQAIEVGKQIGVAFEQGEQFGLLDETGEIDVDDEDAKRKLLNADQKLREWGESKGTSTVDADKKPADRILSAGESRLRAWHRSKGTSTVDANKRPADGKFSEAERRRAAWGRSSATTTIYANTNPAMAAWRSMMASIPKSVNVVVNGIAGTRPNLDYRMGGREGGGVVGKNMPRPGRTDTVPMMAAPGEYVIKASSARALGYANLDALNRTGRIGANVASTYGIAPGGGGSVTNVTQVSVDARGAQVGVGREIVDALTRWSRDNGPLPAAVTGG